MEMQIQKFKSWRQLKVVTNLIEQRISILENINDKNSLAELKILKEYKELLVIELCLTQKEKDLLHFEISITKQILEENKEDYSEEEILLKRIGEYEKLYSDGYLIPFSFNELCLLEELMIEFILSNIDRLNLVDFDNVEDIKEKHSNLLMLYSIKQKLNTL